MRRALIIIEPLALALVPLMLFLCAYWRIDQAALICTAAICLVTLPFFWRYEQKKPRPRDMMPVVIIAAMAAAGRILFMSLPNVMPVTALVILAGIVLGRQNGFLCGALAALGSNLYFGLGLWLPWQMYGWGMAGYLAGMAEDLGLFRRVPAVWIYGALASFGYGLLLDSWHIVGFMRPDSMAGMLAVYAAGVPFNLSHAVSTVLFLLVIYTPWQKKLQRLINKYGIQR